MGKKLDIDEFTFQSMEKTLSYITRDFLVDVIKKYNLTPEERIDLFKSIYDNMKTVPIYTATLTEHQRRLLYSLLDLSLRDKKEMVDKEKEMEE